MRTIDVTLDKGLTIDGATYTDAVLREPAAGDVIDAANESEQLVLVPLGKDVKGNPVTEPQLVASPTATALNILRLQIVNIGKLKAPIDIAVFRKLSAPDLAILQQKADELESASVEVAQRGRSDSASASAE